VSEENGGFILNEDVYLHVPENSRLHGAPATIKELFPWGARVACGAAATGSFRALFSEMLHMEAELEQSIEEDRREEASRSGYTGDACDMCGSFKMRRNGTCQVCDDCGTTSGCS
jgi:ribonucleoside-diphosphate reductase alpha chain